jgi:hypothetical protein
VNTVTVSDDRRVLVISSLTGQRATLHSARPGGFTDNEIVLARDFPLNTKMQLKQVNRARRVNIGGRALYLHCNTGPPTWWTPRLDVRRGKAMVGWLRILVAASWPT